jgi:hypothetical protein
MSTTTNSKRTVSPAARVFSGLQADEALLPGQASALRRSGALFLALLVLGATPLFFAANAAGLIGDLPAAIAKGSNSGPGGDDDDSSGPGSGDDDDDDSGTRLGTDDTSANGQSTRGTTNDNDTNTRLGTDDTSRNGNSTRGTTNDNDTNTNTRNSATGTQTRTRTGS